ncbi:type 4b pilus protein PilO2 [Chromobacterium sp. IIBBL 290-4]|uniref:type 4b pilus protein PilO2 n=1 Tax=Chromobacterium sp. IIBBL 290-4 TaxID=2953890 RepID=UPI0020B7963F|nr:type 4b pilus protein PilO2 [Chromobacterium sp. IIBBL 290-4]UTH74137.1 type 4b pilus protein PilO2 [Chromobacterium sp. IIBBL 290-4]
MAKALNGNLVVGVQWEALLGLSKVADEVRELAAKRGARQFLVLKNALGSQVVGLAALPAKAQRQGLYALAGWLREITDDPNILFLHRDPDDAANAIFIAIHDGKPMHDQILPQEEAIESARRFMQEVGVGVTVLGDETDIPFSVTRRIGLDDIAELLSQGGQEDYRFQPVPRNPLFGLALAAAVLAGLGLGARWWLQQHDQEIQAKLAEAISTQPDEEARYRGQLQAALQAPALHCGSAYAKRMQAAIQQLPRNVGGWRIKQLSCKSGACLVGWLRGEGGSFATLSAVRPAAQFQDMDTAVERVAFADGGGDKAVAPVASSQFYLQTGVRMQALEDYGKSSPGGGKALEAALGKTDPLIPLPPQLRNRGASLPQVSKGAWALSGHLAFLDSVAGLMGRSGNMALDEITVVLSDESPSFAARGTFYVQ